MGQSISSSEQFKQKPIRPTKIFSLVFFQRYYDKVILTDEGLAEKAWGDEKLRKTTGNCYQIWLKEVWPKYSEEEKKGKKPITYWKEIGEKNLIAEVEIQKPVFIQNYLKQLKSGEIITQSQLMANLPATLDDAQQIFQFTHEYLCEMEDITVMCNKKDFKRIHTKPEYEGHFIDDMFLWVYNKYYNQKHLECVQTAWQAIIEQKEKEHKDNNTSNSTQDEQDDENDLWEDWNELERMEVPLKYQAKQPFLQWRNDDLQHKIKEWKTWDDNQDHENWDVNFVFQCDDFWLNNQPARHDQLQKKMQPHIYLKEREPSYQKIQHNWLFQQLDKREKFDFLQSRIPKWIDPSLENYKKYIDSIETYANNNPKEQILSMQTFACHGLVSNGAQECVINKLDTKDFFYERIRAEFYTRSIAVKYPNVFFLLLFACCRESYFDNKYKKGKENTNSTQESRGQFIEEIASGKIANFTFFYGCDPASGVAADTKFVKKFIEHIMENFDPETGTCVIPEVINLVDSSKEKVNFESTSSNLGRSLMLVNKHNRVGVKMLVVITESPQRIPTQKTMAMIDFIITNLQFTNDQLLIINETEAKQLEQLLNPSFVYKEHNRRLEEGPLGEIAPLGLKSFARQLFKNARADGRQLLSIFLNECEDEDVKDFVTSRNPEFALNIEPWYNLRAKTLPQKQADKFRLMDKNEPEKRIKFINDLNNKMKAQWEHKWTNYFEPIQNYLDQNNQVRFENNHRLFVHEDGNFTFCSWHKKFKEYTGQFDLILDLQEKSSKTIKSQFNFLEKTPVRYSPVTRNTFGCCADEKSEKQLIVTLESLDPDEEKKTEEEELFADPCDYQKKVLKCYYVNKEGKKFIDSETQENFQIGGEMSVLKLKKLYIDEKKKELYFALIFKKSEGLILGRIDYKNAGKEGSESKSEIEFRQIIQFVDQAAQNLEKKAYSIRKRNEKQAMKDQASFQTAEEQANSAFEAAKKAFDEKDIVLSPEDVQKLKTELDQKEKESVDAKKKLANVDYLIPQFLIRENYHYNRIANPNSQEFLKYAIDDEKEEKKQKQELEKLEKDSEAYKAKVQEFQDKKNQHASAMKKADIYEILKDLKDPQSLNEQNKNAFSELRNQRWDLDFDELKIETLDKYHKEVQEDQRRLEEKQDKTEEEQKLLEKLNLWKEKIELDTNYPIMGFSDTGLDVAWIVDEKDENLKKDRRLYDQKTGEIKDKNFGNYINAQVGDDFKTYNVKQQIENDHMRVFASKGEKEEGNCLFYILTNKIGKLNKPTPLEMQVFEWEPEPSRQPEFHSKERQLHVFATPPFTTKRQDFIKGQKTQRQTKAQPLNTAQINNILDEINSKDKKSYLPLGGLKQVLGCSLLEHQFNFNMMLLNSKDFRKHSKKWLDKKKFLAEEQERLKQEFEANGNDKERQRKLFLLRKRDLDEQLEKAEEKYTWSDVEMWRKYPKSIKQSSDNKTRLIYSDPRGNYVFDFQMGIFKSWDGKIRYLRAYKFQDIEKGTAFGLQKRPFTKCVDMIDPNFTSFMISDREARWQTQSVLLSELEKGLVLSKSLKLPKVIRLPKYVIQNFIKQGRNKSVNQKAIQQKDEELEQVPQFYFSFEDQAINLVSKESLKEFLLVKQRTTCMYDRLCEPWITYNKTSVTLHYFETRCDYRNIVTQSNYTTFVLTEDFLSSIVSCGEIIPSDKTQMISHQASLQKQIRDAKKNQSVEIEIANRFKEEQQIKLEEEKSKKIQENVDKLQKFLSEINEPLTDDELKNSLGLDASDIGNVQKTKQKAASNVFSKTKSLLNRFGVKNTQSISKDDFLKKRTQREAEEKKKTENSSGKK